MEIDPTLRRELTKRFEIESYRKEIEITETWRKDLDAIYRKRHESMASLLSDIRALMERMNNRVKTLAAMVKEG
jgi:peptidoglycan hydrolase CwlO-like protein